MIDNPTNTTSDQLAKQRRQFDACLARRNRVEFVAGGAAMAFLIVAGAIGLSGSTNVPDTLAAFGLIVVATGLGITLWRLSSHIHLQSGHESGVSPRIAFARRLKQERDLLRTIWAWYIGPLLPGFVLTWGGIFAGGAVGTALIGVVATVAAIAWIWRANIRAADKFDRQLHAIAAQG